MDNSTFNMNELLIRYLDGELTGNEKIEFENRLSADKLLQEEFQSLQLTRESVRSYGLKQKVAAIHEQMMDELSTPVRKISSTRRFVQYSLAIAASLLLIFISIQAYTFFTLSSDKLFSQNYRSYELNTVRSSGTEPTAIEKAYQEKQFNEVVTLSENSNDIKINFLAAMANMELKNTSKAIEGYKKVITLNQATNTNMFKDEAEYYLSLALVQNKDYREALPLMQKIHDDPNHLYHEKVSSKFIRKVKWLKWR
jgi:tetratricopeptide (TPR) repeat protein